MDLNQYKKIFCSNFSRFDYNKNINPYKSFNHFYSLVKEHTSVISDASDIENNICNTNLKKYFKSTKEFENLRVLDKTNKIITTINKISENDPGFIGNIDVNKVIYHL